MDGPNQNAEKVATVDEPNETAKKPTVEEPDQSADEEKSFQFEDEDDKTKKITFTMSELRELVESVIDFTLETIGSDEFVRRTTAKKFVNDKFPYYL